MDIQILTSFFMWCTIINGGLFILWLAFFVFAPNFTYNLQNKFIPLSREKYDLIIFSFLGLFKILFLLFNLVPYIVLLILGQ